MQQPEPAGAPAMGSDALAPLRRRFADSEDPEARGRDWWRARRQRSRAASPEGVRRR